MMKYLFLDKVDLDNDELGRRAVHLSGLIFPTSYLITGNQVLTICFILVSLFIATLFEYLRLRTDFDNYVYRRLTREYEEYKLAGYYLYIVGLLFSWVFFESEIALVSSFVLAISDPIGGLLSDESGDKTKLALAGTFTSSLLICILILGYTEISNILLVILGLLCGVTTSISDSYIFKLRGEVVDDNLLIPILTGFVVTVGKYAYLILI